MRQRPGFTPKESNVKGLQHPQPYIFPPDFFSVHPVHRMTWKNMEGQPKGYVVKTEWTHKT